MTIPRGGWRLRTYKTLGAATALIAVIVLGGRLDLAVMDASDARVDVPSAPRMVLEVDPPDLTPLREALPRIDVPGLQPVPDERSGVEIPPPPSTVVTPRPPDLSVLEEPMPVIRVPELRTGAGG